MFPIGFLRVLLALIGIGAAFMAGRTMAAVRQGLIKAGRHYAWMVRAIVCLAALTFRHRLDAVMIGAWVLSPAAFAKGWHGATHRKPPEDLSQDIVPKEGS